MTDKKSAALFWVYLSMLLLIWVSLLLYQDLKLTRYKSIDRIYNQCIEIEELQGKDNLRAICIWTAIEITEGENHDR